MPKALIVDDEEEICEFIGQFFEDKFSFEVKTAFSGQKALEFAEKEVFDFCMVDLKLSSSMTGMQVIAEIRKKQPHAKVIAMSGYIDIGLRQEAEKAGVVAFFEKPTDFQPDILESKINSLILNPGA